MTQHLATTQQAVHPAGKTPAPGPVDPKDKASADAAARAKRAEDKAKKKRAARDMAAAKICAGILACVAMPVVVGEALHAFFHVHKDNTLIVTVALYPVIVIVIGWILVRALFMSGGNPNANGTPLPPETPDHGTRDDGSTLM